MRRGSLFLLGAFLLFAGLAQGQSLAEIAKKEKERRQKNKSEGAQVRVISEKDLPAGRPMEITSSEESSSPVPSPSSAQSPPGAETAGSEGSEETLVPAEIPREGSLQDKLRVFEELLKAHQAEVQKIDAEIAKNNSRLTGIEQELISIGGSGLPTAPPADLAPRYEGDAVALRNEQQELRDKNRDLEAQKVRMREDLRDKARRAGIPPGYLRF